MATLTPDEALSKAKIGLMAKPDSVFFTTLCFSLRFKWEESISTADVDGITMRINPKFFLELSADERIFVLVHESMHPALLHTIRGKGKNHDRFNRAADHVINLMLEARGFKMPNWVLKDPQFNGMSTEEVYDLLKEEPNPPARPMGSDIREADKADEEMQAHIENVLIQASIQAKAAGNSPGSIPGDIQIFLDRLLNPKLPWNKILQKFFNSFKKSDYSWTKPNRRFAPKYHLPSLHSRGLGKVAIAVDTSGSVSDEEFNRCVSETHAILRMLNPEEITFIQFDTEIKSVNRIKTVKELMGLKFTGRGGTLIGPVIEWANENKPQVLLVFSDGYFRFYELETKVQTIWLIHQRKDFTAPFGKVINYEI